MDFLTNIDTNIILGIKICLIAILGDTAVTWLLAFIEGEFDIRKAPQFIKTNVLPYIGGLLIVAILAITDVNYMPVFIAITSIITAKFGVEIIKDKLIAYFQGNTITK